jgi:hypothetical protein
MAIKPRVLNFERAGADRVQELFLLLRRSVRYGMKSFKSA